MVLIMRSAKMMPLNMLARYRISVPYVHTHMCLVPESTRMSRDRYSTVRYGTDISKCFSFTLLVVRTVDLFLRATDFLRTGSTVPLIFHISWCPNDWHTTYVPYRTLELHNVDPKYSTVQMIDVCTYVPYVQSKEFFSTKNDGEIPHFIILEPS